jgi:hypothetical protein
LFQNLLFIEHKTTSQPNTEHGSWNNDNVPEKTSDASGAPTNGDRAESLLFPVTTLFVRSFFRSFRMLQVQQWTRVGMLKHLLKTEWILKATTTNIRIVRERE